MAKKSGREPSVPEPGPRTTGLNMFCVLDRPKGREGSWNYFNMYPTEPQAKKAADTIMGYKDSNRDATVVPVFVPFPP